MNDKSEKPNFDVKTAVLARLEQENIKPRSKLYWTSYEYALWATWVLTVLFGAVSLAILSFTSLHLGYAIYEATHTNFLTFLLENLPYVWLVGFLVLSLLSYYNLRYTKRGYRYPVLLVIGSSVGFSLLGAGLLHYLGVGYYFDRFLGENVAHYESRAEFELKMWQRPLSGRLVGVGEITSAPLTANIVPFSDVVGESWNFNTTELTEKSLKLLQSGKQVRVLIATTSANGVELVYACAVFPWIMDHPPMIAEFRENRLNFVEGARGRQKEKKNGDSTYSDSLKSGAGQGVNKDTTPSDMLLVPSSAESAKTVATNFGPESPCANLPLFKRIRFAD